MNLLLTLSRLSALCFVPFWLLFDVTRIVRDENVVSSSVLPFVVKWVFPYTSIQ